MKKQKYLVLLLLPIILMGFLSVGYSQVVNDTSIISLSGVDWSLKVDSALASSIDSRNTPYMTSKSTTEKELFLELATLEDCKSGVVQFKIDMQGLTAYKQLPLTQEEIEEGSFRPKNVENSFALFDSDGKKVAHIYGSKITDAKGVEVWLDQNLQDGLLTVVLPKPEVLETLSFPLLLDPTFGYTTIGGSTGGSNTIATNCQFELTENATIESITYRTSGTGDLDIGIYNGTTLLVNLTSTVPSANVWQTFDITDLIYTAGTYGLALKFNDASLRYCYDTVATNQTINDSGLGTSDGLPNPIQIDSYLTRQVSIYANYTIYVGPTPTPFVSATPFPEGAMDDTDWWISILVVMLIIINIFLMMLPFALVRFVFGILSLFLCMLALTYQIPLSPYLQTAGLLISALAMLFSVRARE